MGIIIISFIILFIITLLYFISFYLSPIESYTEKLSPYESGFTPIGIEKIKYEIIYQIIGILYLIFDLEIVLIFPFVTNLYLIKNYIGQQLLFYFIFILTIAFIYEQKFNALIIK